MNDVRQLASLLPLSNGFASSPVLSTSETGERTGKEMRGEGGKDGRGGQVLIEKSRRARENR